MGTRFAAKLPVLPESLDDDYSEEIIASLEGFKSSAIKTVVERVLKSMESISLKLENSKEPLETAANNTLHLEHTTSEVVQVFVDYMYKEKLPVLLNDSPQALNFLCRIHDLAVHLQMYAVANRCVDLIALRSDQLLNPRHAIPVLTFTGKKEHVKNCRRIRQLILKLLAHNGGSLSAACDSSEFSAIMKALDEKSLAFLAMASMLRVQRLKALSAMKTDPDIKDEDVDYVTYHTFVEWPVSESSAPATAEQWVNSREFCSTYHWHMQGETCFSKDDLFVQDAKQGSNAPSELPNTAQEETPVNNELGSDQSNNGVATDTQGTRTGSVPNAVTIDGIERQNGPAVNKQATRADSAQSIDGIDSLESNGNASGSEYAP